MTDPDAIKAARRQLSRLPADHPEVKHAHEMLDRATTGLARGDIRFACELIFKAGMSAAIAAVDPLLERERQNEYREGARKSNLKQFDAESRRALVMQKAKDLREMGYTYTEAMEELDASGTSKVEPRTLKKWLKKVYPAAECPKPGRPKKNN